MTNGSGNIMSYRQAIKRNNKRISECYTALGIRSYSLIKQGVISSGELEVVVAEIVAIAAENASYEQAIINIKAAREAARGVRCTYCGTVGSPGSKFCPGCGQNQAKPAVYPGEGMTICPACHSATDADSKFCVLCGTQLPEAVPVNPEPIPVEPEAVSVNPEEVQAEEVQAELEPVLAEPEMDIAEAKSTCPHCGDALEEAAVFCVTCGNKTEE